jgi:uncharacterized membrane protein
MSLLKDLLQGKWLGHPLHPALVHVPTGLFPAALLFDLIASAGGEADVLGRCAFWSIGVGLVAALAVAPTGLADWWDIKRGKPAYRLGLIHMSINVAVFAAMAASFYLRWRRGVPWAPSGVAIVANVLGNLMLAVSGYLGGRMVFDRGAGVGRLSKKKWERFARAGHARLPVD